MPVEIARSDSSIVRVLDPLVLVTQVRERGERRDVVRRVVGR